MSLLRQRFWLCKMKCLAGLHPDGTFYGVSRIFKNTLLSFIIMMKKKTLQSYHQDTIKLKISGLI